VNGNSSFLGIRITLLAALVVLLGVACGCSSQADNKAVLAAPPGGVLLQGAGATFPSPLYKEWFTAYHADHPKTLITYDVVGSGEGIRRFLGENLKKEDERVDFGASDAALRDDQLVEVPKGALMLPVTAGSVVLAYNLPDFEGELKLSRRAYAGIFLGEIKYWNDPLIAKSNPGVKLPRLTIARVVRQEGSGTTYAFTRHLDAINEEWRARYGPAILVNWPGDAMRATGNEGVAGRIKQSVGSIGYVNFDFARKIGLKVATLENKEGNYIRPSVSAGTTALAGAQMPENLRVFVPDPPGADAYPIVTFTWILLYKNYPDSAKATAVRDLFHWCLTDGQKYSADLGYMPLPPNVAQKALSALDGITPQK
jgi:phosphate transport system substrate-binding protein